MHSSGKIFDKICLKAIRNTNMFFQYVICDQGTGGLNFSVGVVSNIRGKFKLFVLQGDPPQFPPLVGNLDLLIRKTLRRVLYPLTVMILKRMSESIFFQINKFTACKFTKEVANSLMAFNLLKIIHPFQGKKHLRT